MKKILNGKLVELTEAEKAEIEAKRIEREAYEASIEYKTKQVREKRRSEYLKKFGSLENELDQLFHDIDSGYFGQAAKMSPFYQKIKKVKSDNPKPVE